MKTNIFIAFLFWSLSMAVTAQRTLPIESETVKIQSLRGLLDESLQVKLEAEMKANPKWRKLLADKKLAIGLVDLSDPEHVKFARINGAHMMYAASLPKIAVLLASMDAIDKGELKETAEVKKDLLLMISKSNNAASTRMIDRLGYEKIEAVMTDPKYEFYDEEHGGGLWVGKRYGGGGATNREPL